MGSKHHSMKRIRWIVGNEACTRKAVDAVERKQDVGDSRVPDPRADSVGEGSSERGVRPTRQK